MQRTVRWLLAGTGLLLIGGCSEPTYDLSAGLAGGQLVFELENPVWFGLAPPPDIVADTFEVRDGDRVLWRIVPSGRPDCRGRTRGLQFPIAYGAIPPCYAAQVPHVRLPEGRMLRVEAWGRSFAGGNFKIEDGSIENGCCREGLAETGR